MSTKQTQGSAFVDLPNDMVWDILLRLPSTSLLRCRAVCKTWRSLATDGGLLLAHHRRQQPQPLLLAFLRDAGEDDKSVLHCCVEAVDFRTDKRRVVARFTERRHELEYRIYGRFEVHASCDGLLLVSCLQAFFVCNPATRQATPLPPLHAREVAGLYSHVPSGEYRVLYHRRYDGPKGKYYVLTVGTQQARSVEPRASSASVGKALARGVGRVRILPPVLLHGSLHWPPQECQEDNILVFDTAAESFRWISPPVTPRTDTSLQFACMLLFEMDGKLGMSCCKQNVWGADLWLMQDYKEEIWVCKHRIELSVIKPDVLTYWDAVIVSQEGDMLVEGSESVLHYDMNGEIVGTFDYDGCSIEITPHVLKESLVQHAFFQTQQNGGTGEPPFFLGL